ncbi:hypothetical protein A0256_16555 [Mucilaginibacter sp. PAMC 26640]|nr:hypothetical protein A0256_16555 [Mucilaginibacter sp. PAMC 26640]
MTLLKHLPEFKGFTPIKIKRFMISLGAAILLKLFISCSHTPKPATLSHMEKITVKGGTANAQAITIARRKKKN